MSKFLKKICDTWCSCHRISSWYLNFLPRSGWL